MNNETFISLFNHTLSHRQHHRFFLLTIVPETGELAIVPFVRKGERDMIPVPPHRHLAGPNVDPNVTVNVGHLAGMVIRQFDTNGNPMLTPVTFDAPPVWTQTTPATDTLAPAADGNSATATAVAPGTDTITCTATFQSVAYVAQQPLTVSPAPQVFGGIALVTTVQ